MQTADSLNWPIFTVFDRNIDRIVVNPDEFLLLAPFLREPKCLKLTMIIEGYVGNQLTKFHFHIEICIDQLRLSIEYLSGVLGKTGVSIFSVHCFDLLNPEKTQKNTEIKGDLYIKSASFYNTGLIVLMMNLKFNEFVMLFSVQEPIPFKILSHAFPAQDNAEEYSYLDILQFDQKFGTDVVFKFNNNEMQKWISLFKTPINHNFAKEYDAYLDFKKIKVSFRFVICENQTHIQMDIDTWSTDYGNKNCDYRCSFDMYGNFFGSNKGKDPNLKLINLFSADRGVWFLEQIVLFMKKFAQDYNTNLSENNELSSMGPTAEKCCQQIQQPLGEKESTQPKSDSKNSWFSTTFGKLF